MAERMRVVSVRREMVDHDRGHWCRVCLLPTGLRAHIALTLQGRMMITQMVWCEDCGSRSIDVESDGRHP